MDWLPHVVIKAEHDACAKTATTALRTLHVGFPDQTATVHLISQNPTIIKYVKQLCTAGGHKLIQYGSSVRGAQLNYKLVKNSRLPIVLIRGTVVFYDDMSDYSTTKLFGGDTLPCRYMFKGNDKVVIMSGIEKSIVFVAQPQKLCAEVDCITSLWSADDEGPNQRGSQKWGQQWVIKDGIAYEQESGVFNLMYHWDKSQFSNFNKKTASKYESVFAGNNFPDMVEVLNKNGEETDHIIKYVDCALNDDWDGIRGARDTLLDNLKETVIKSVSYTHLTLPTKA